MLYYLKIWPPQPKKNTYPWSTPFEIHPRRDDSFSWRSDTCEIRRISRCLLQACGYRNDCLFDVCAARAAARLGCLGFRPQCEPTASLSGLKSCQLGTQQMRWIMLIHGGELWENVCFTLQRVVRMFMVSGLQSSE